MIYILDDNLITCAIDLCSKYLCITSSQMTTGRHGGCMYSIDIITRWYFNTFVHKAFMLGGLPSPPPD